MTKSSEKSDLLRIEGNQFYNQKLYYKALVRYNESLCFAEADTEMMGLAYGNRSAIFFEMKLYDKCLNNITLAKQSRYPERNIEILNKREEKCLALLKQSKDDKVTLKMHQFFKLSYPPHKKLSFIAECLEVKYDSMFGRHIVTNLALKVGDIVAIEEPFCKIVRDRFIHQMCAWCFNSNLLDLLPCYQCNKAMFCSRECETKAFESFHKCECPLREMLCILTTDMQMALRVLFTAFSLFNESIEDLQNYLLENSKPCTILELEDPDKMQNKVLAINSLIASDESNFNDKICKEIFEHSPHLKKMWSTHSNFIINFLKKQTQIGTLNYHEIYIWPMKRGGLQDDDVDTFSGSLSYQRGTVAAGNGSYPFCSLINHQCAPNVSRVFVNDKLVMIVQRTIKKGDQLFDNYGYHFTNVAKDYRQMHLLKQYNFKCRCDACVKDWPILSALKISDKLCLNKAKKACRELNLADLNRKKALNKYKELTEIIIQKQKNFPSLEICSIMQSAAAYLELTLKPEFQFS